MESSVDINFVLMGTTDILIKISAEIDINGFSVFQVSTQFNVIIEFVGIKFPRKDYGFWRKAKNPCHAYEVVVFEIVENGKTHA